MNNKLKIESIILGLLPSILSESFKDKVKQYNINNPFLMNFLLRYENAIDWATIKTAKQRNSDIQLEIQNQIKNILIEFKKSKKDATHKNTMLSTEKDINWNQEVAILKTEIEQGNQDAATALQHFTDDPETSKQNILTSINDGKIAIFEEWNGYLSYNDLYKSNYAFQYILYKTILDQSGKTRNPPSPVNAAIVANIYEKIKSHPTEAFNVEKTYKNFYSNYLESKNQIIKGEKGNWMKIPSKSEDSENYEQNIKDLMNMAYKSWCIRQDTFARKYLGGGAFWLYYVEDSNQNKYAEIAIRLSGNTIAEIRGATTNQDVPPEYEPIIASFLEKAKDISGGQAFLNQYYRKINDTKYHAFFDDNYDDLIRFYEQYMSSEYIDTNLTKNEYTASKESRLLDWWNNRGDRPPKLQEDASQMELGLNIPLDSFAAANDNFKFNALMVGLATHSNLTVQTNQFGYNYYIVDEDYSLNDFYKETADPLIGAFTYIREHGAEVNVYQIDYSAFIDMIKEDNPTLFERLEYMLMDTEYDIRLFFSHFSSELSDGSFYSAQQTGEENAYENAVHDSLIKQLPDAIDGFSIEQTSKYFPDPEEEAFNITMSHKDLIVHLLDNFSTVNYEEYIDWKSNWNKMNDDVYYGDMDMEGAKYALFEDFDFDDYLFSAAKEYADVLVNSIISNRDRYILLRNEADINVDKVTKTVTILGTGQTFKPILTLHDKVGYFFDNAYNILQESIALSLQYTEYDISPLYEANSAEELYVIEFNGQSGLFVISDSQPDVQPQVKTESSKIDIYTIIRKTLS